LVYNFRTAFAFFDRKIYLRYYT